jgi:hypothetical protein
MIRRVDKEKTFMMLDILTSNKIGLCTPGIRALRSFAQQPFSYLAKFRKDLAKTRKGLTISISVPAAPMWRMRIGMVKSLTGKCPRFRSIDLCAPLRILCATLRNSLFSVMNTPE